MMSNSDLHWGWQCAGTCVPEEVCDTPAAEPMTHAKSQRLSEVILVIPLPSAWMELNITFGWEGGALLREARTCVEGSGGGEFARDLFEKLSIEGRSRAFPGCRLLGFPIIESASSSRELLLAG